MYPIPPKYPSPRPPGQSPAPWLAAASGLLLLLLSTTGCATSTEVQASSSDLGEALESLRSSQDEIRLLYLDQLEDTRWQIVETVLAERVNARIRHLSANQPGSNLIQVADALRQERSRARASLARIVAIEAHPSADPGELLDGELARVSEELGEPIDGLSPEAAEELRRQEEGVSDFRQLVEAHRSDLLNIVQLSATQAAVAEGFHDLDLYLQFLASIQRQLNLWLTTAAEVDGADLADLVDENAALFERRSTAGGGGTP